MFGAFGGLLVTLITKQEYNLKIILKFLHLRDVINRVKAQKRRDSSNSFTRLKNKIKLRVKQSSFQNIQKVLVNQTRLNRQRVLQKRRNLIKGFNYLLFHAHLKQLHLLTLNENQKEQVLRLIQVVDVKQGEELPSDSTKLLELNLNIVLSGSVELREYIGDNSELVKKYESGELIFLNEETKAHLITSEKPDSTQYKLICIENAQVVYIQRSLLNKILEVSFERFEKEFKTKINCLKSVFPNIAKAEQGVQRQKSKHFKLYGQSTKGTVMTTTTSGSNDIFVVSKGKILVWVPKSKINQDYSEEFILIGLQSENSMFNESYVLFSKECIYGTMMIGEGANEIFQLSKENIGQACDNQTQEYLKASSEIKDRMYKNHIKRYSGYSVSEINQKQNEFCTKLGLNYDSIKEQFKKSTKDKKIVTHNLINKNEFNKNLENFNKIMQKSTFKTTELQGDKEDIASTVTPRLVSRGNGLNSMTPAQQLSLIALRSSGKGLREGTRNINQKISDIDFDQAEQEKKNLTQITAGGILVKKNIQQVDFRSKSEAEQPEKVEKKEISEESKETIQPLDNKDVGGKKTLHQKLEVSNTSLLKKLGQFDAVKQVQPESEKEGSKQNSSNGEAQKNPGFIQMSEFSLKTTNKEKPFNSVFLNIAKEEINQVEKPKVEDKFAQQRKKLLNFGI